MINPKQIFKAGRTTKIFEVNDKLTINDFYEESGYKTSTPHGIFSRVEIVIVDVTKGSKDKANVNNFSFRAEEWEDFSTSLRYDGNTFAKNTKILSITKANPYKSYPGNRIEVKNIKITFEDKLRTPKWKVEISKGTAVKADDDFGYKSNTYTKQTDTNFLLDEEEKRLMVRRVSKYIRLWEMSIFNEFIYNRDKFIERAKANNFEEATISVWNAKSGPNEKGMQPNNIKPQTQNGNFESCNCTVCNAVVNEKTAQLVKKTYGKVICTKCLTEKNKRA